MDPGYRRLKYTRYADDHIIGFTGPKAEAEEIKARLAEFLRETLGLELNQDKTLITHARTQRARFLGYDISVWHCNTKITSGRRSANGKIALRVPPDVITAQCARYRKHGKPWHRPPLQPGRLRDRPDLRSRVPRRHQLLVRHEAHCSYRPRSGRGPEEVVRGPDGLPGSVRRREP